MDCVLLYVNYEGKDSETDHWMENSQWLLKDNLHFWKTYINWQETLLQFGLLGSLWDEKVSVQLLADEPRLIYLEQGDFGTYNGKQAELLEPCLC